MKYLVQVRLEFIKTVVFASNLCNIFNIHSEYFNIHRQYFILVYIQVSQGGILQKDMEKSVCN